MESIKGVGCGILLFLLAFPLLFWNEGRAVHRAKGLAAGKSQVVSTSSDKVDPAHEGKLVHLTGMATAAGTLKDEQFAIAAPNALQLKRQVEMYQWKQNEKTKTRKKLGGGKETITTYTYEQVWDDDVLDSSNYKEAKRNPTSMLFESQSWQAPDAKVGAFSLGGLTGKVSDWSRIDLTSSSNGLKPSGGYLYSSADPSSPEIGDCRVSFQQVKPAQVSIVAVQKGDGFTPFDSGEGDSGLYELVMGEQSSDQMFQSLESQNTAMTWILRLAGFFMMAVGIGLVFQPLVIVADVVPFVGTLLETGLGFVAFALATPLTLITIAVGWIVYRPLIGIVLLVVAIAIGVFAFKAARSRKS
jgi:hypothetical protein